MITKKMLGLSEVAEVLGVKKNVVNNWASREKDFPLPVQQNAAGALWDAKDIAEYANRKKNMDIIVVTPAHGRCGRMCIVGRPRVGKSFFTALFVEKRTEYMRLFCSDGDDKTQCDVQNIIVDDDFAEYFTFHSDFNSKNDWNTTDNGLNELKEDVSKVVGQKIILDDEGIAKEKLRVIENVVKRIHQIEETYEDKIKSDTYITVYLQPNQRTKNLLRRVGLQSLEIIDTQGVAGDVNITKVAKADLYVFILRPENQKESESLKKIVTVLKPYTASSKVIFLYKLEGSPSSKETYRMKSDRAKEGASHYESHFAELKGNIIDTDLEILSVAQNTILFPTIDEVELTAAESYFFEEMETKFCDTFGSDKENHEKEEFRKVLEENGKEAQEYVLSILKGIPKREYFELDKQEYTINEFRQNSHDRVMTNDRYRLRSNLNEMYIKEVMHLHDYFIKIDTSIAPKNWQQIVVKFIYKTLLYSIRKDRGIGIGTHQWEENPPRTMLVEESIAAGTVLGNIDDILESDKNKGYRKALQKVGVTSKTWGYAGCCVNEDSYPEALKKLQIIDHILSKIKVSSEKNMVWCRYIGGLRMIAEYQLLEQMGFCDADAMKELASFPV